MNLEIRSDAGTSTVRFVRVSQGRPEYAETTPDRKDQ